MPGLTNEIWVNTFAFYRKHPASNETVRALASMLEEIARSVDDPKLNDIFDTYADHMLRSTE